MNAGQRELYLRNTGRATESYCRDLLRRAYGARGESLAHMTRLTRLAIAVADSLPEGKRAAGLRAQAHGTQANALRIRHRLDEAEREIARAWECWRQSPRSPWLRAFLLEIQASLQESRRDLSGALQTLREAVAARRRCRSRRGLAKVLTQCGIVLAYSGHLEESTVLFYEALPLVGDAKALGSAVVSLMWVLTESDRARDAACVFEKVAPVIQTVGNLETIRIGWLRGRIMGGLGAVDAARHLLSEAAASYRKQGMLVEEALVTLDLAKVAYREQAWGEVVRLADAVGIILQTLGYTPESSAAKSLVGIAALEATTPTLIQTVAATLMRTASSGHQTQGLG